MPMIMDRWSRFRFFITPGTDYSLCYSFTGYRPQVCLLRFFRINSRDGGASNLDDRLLSASDQETGVAYRGYHPDDPTGGDHFVAGFQLRNRSLQLALFSLLRPDKQQIKNAK